MPSNSRKWYTGIAKFFTRSKIDFIGNISDAQYYRIGNRTKESIQLDVKDLEKAVGLPKHFPLQPDKKENFTGRALNAIGKEEILEQVYKGNISFQPLNIDRDTTYRISNRTGRRVGIPNIEEEKGYGNLVIPPFGTRTINSELLKYYKFLEWQRQDLIRVEREDQAYDGASSLSRLWGWVKLLPGFIFVGLAGVGIPLWIVYNYGGGEELLASGEIFGLAGLGRIFQLGLICVASILPALFYYLFGRQQVEKLREKFFHDILVLDPHLYTLSEADAKYSTLLSSAFGAGSSNSPFAILLLIISTALFVTGWTLTITPYGPLPQPANSLTDFFKITVSPLSLSFLGVYFFSINMIFRRYVRADLTPKTYASIIVRLLVSLVLVLTISVLPANGALMENGFLAVAFIIGVFPEDGFRIIRDAARKAVPGLRGGGDEKYPITELEGMNQYDQARLLEEGIENIENLAHHNLIELLAFTRIPTARLVDMFDQAILYLHLGIFDSQKEDSQGNSQASGETPVHNGSSKSGKELLHYLKSFGVRTATDLDEILKDENTVKAIGDENMINHLWTIRTTFRDDEWLSYIMNWRRESSKEAAVRASFVTDPDKFYDTGSKETDSPSWTQVDTESKPAAEEPTNSPPADN